MFRKFSFAVALTAAVMFSPTAIAGKGHGGHGHVGMELGIIAYHKVVMDMVVMDMVVMDMATRLGTIIGTTATGTVTVVIGAVVGTDME